MEIKIAGRYISSNKKIILGLTSIYGIGQKTALDLCKFLNLNPNIKLKDLEEKTLESLQYYIENEMITGKEIKKQQSTQIEFLRQIGTYRGMRHRHGLPVRGQRTHSNAKSYKRIKGLIKTAKKK